MPRKVKLILNPMADMGDARRVADGLRSLAAEYSNADWSETSGPTHATELARQAAGEGYEMVVAVGGDGTVHEVINGLMQVPEKQRPILGVVPIGSGNDFAHVTGIPLEPAAALAHALKGEPSFIDVGRLQDEHGRSEYFDNTLGIGFDTVVTLRSHKITFLRGFLMYLVAVIQTIILDFDPAPMHIETDKTAWDEHSLMLVVCNGPREGGGFLVAPEAKPDDGIFHYASIGDIGRLMMFRLVPEVMKGTHGRFKCVRMGDCHKMTLKSEKPLFIHLDGEIFTGFDSNVKQLAIEILPGALKVVRGG
jgi:YegS/Rv2252/BmrU family lipid kinase